MTISRRTERRRRSATAPDAARSPAMTSRGYLIERLILPVSDADLRALALLLMDEDAARRSRFHLLFYKELNQADE